MNCQLKLQTKNPRTARDRLEVLVEQTGWRRDVKRAFDVLTASSGLLLLSPVIGLTALAVRAALGKPILFKQERPGKGGRAFTVLKFRTMRSAQSAGGRPLSDAERLTTAGRWIRSLSLDELPQLWNVVRGDMSLVGPRPLLMKYLPLYDEFQARRHEVLPGITGWAQVNGRNAVTHEQRFVLDVWYVDNWSLALDARVLWKTAYTLVRRSGIASPNHATMPEFTGYSSARGSDEPAANGID